MTKLLLPVKTGGLETPRREIDTCHMHTHALIHCVHREYLLLVGGSFHVGDQSSMLTTGSVFRLRFNHRLSVTASLLIHPSPCVFSQFPPLYQLICPSLLNFSCASLCSGHCPEVPHYQVSNAEAIPQWDDDEKRVQGSEVCDSHCWLHPSTAGWSCKRNTLSGGGQHSGCKWELHAHSVTEIHLHANIL